MAEIGTLYFGIGGDDKELRKIFEDRKKDAEELQNLLSKINFGSKDSTKQYTESVKLLEQQNKLIVSNAKAEAAREKAAATILVAEQKVNDAIERGNAEKLKSIKLDNDRLTSEQRLRTETEKTEAVRKQQLVSGAKLASIESERAAKEALSQQKLLTEIQRTEAAKKRAALVGTTGQESYNRALELTNKTMFNQKALLQQLSNAMGIYFSIYQAGAFVKELAMVSGEFEKQRLSLAAILQNEEAAARIFNQIRDLAVYSPFNFKELTDYAKQLSAFSIPTNELFETMKRLADISAGLGVDMGRIILAYGQVRSAAVLRGQELRQFTEAGIPLVDELAKKFGELEDRVVSAGEVFDKISNREVPFAMIKEIFQDMTDEGGKFYQMQEIQATSLAGMISNLRDAYDIMLDSIGEANRGLLKGVVGGLVDVMDNWEKYWKILKAIIVAYGTYRAVLIAATIAQQGMALAQQVTFFMNLSRAITGTSFATNILTTSFNGLKAAIATNPIGALAVAISSIVGLLIAFQTETKSTEEILNDLENSMESFTEATDESQNRLSKLLDIYEELSPKTNRNESEQNKLYKVMSDLAKAVPEAAKEFDEYGRVLSINSDIVRQYNEQQKQYARERLQNQMEATKKEIAELQRLVNGYTYVLENGKAALTGYSQYGTTLTTTENLDSEEIIEYQNLRAEASEKLTLALNKLSKAEDVLNGVLSTTNAESEQLAHFAQQINKEIDNLNIGDNLKAKIRVTDVTKDFKTIREEAEKLYDEWTEKVVQMNAAPSLFLPEDKKVAEEMLSLYKSYLEILGGVQQKKKSTSTKDTFTENLKEQVNLIKQAKTEYDKLLKVMSQAEAAETLKNVNAYKDVDINYLTDEGYMDYLTKQLSLIEKRNTDAAKNVRTSWNKEIAQIQLSGITEKAKKEINNIEKYLSQYKTQYNLYEQLLSISGDKGQSAKIAFGDITSEVKSYVDILKNEFSKISKISYEDFIDLSDTEKQKILIKDNVKKLVDQIEQTLQDQDFSLKLDAARLIAEYQSTEEKITAIHKKYEAERQKQIEAGNYTTEYADASVKAEQAEIDALRDKMLQLTPFYQELFGDLSTIGYRHLKRLADQANDIVNKIVENGNEIRDINGNVTGYGFDFEDENGETKKYTVTIQMLDKLKKKANEVNRSIRQDNPFGALKDAFDDFKNATDSEGKSDALSRMGASIKDIGDLVDEVGTSFGNMFSALGEEDAADTIGLITDISTSLADMAKDLSSGNPIQMAVGTIKGVTSIVTSIADYHDKRLDKAIRRSQLEVKKLENAYSDLQRVIERQLGAITESQAETQIKNLEKQRQEIEYQREKEIDKKKTDWNTVTDYENQIAELNDQIRYFYEDLAGEQFDITIKDWAKSIADSLVSAWSAGENAAKAFDDTVADIMKNVFKNVLQLQYIEPAMEQLRKYLFGDGNSMGILGDGDLSASDMNGIVLELSKLKGSLEDWQAAWDILSEAAKQAGINLEDTTNKDTLSKGIQTVTEDTANLLASYINSMRAYLAQQVSMVQRIMLAAENNTNTFALMQADIMLIQINTLATANNTTRLVELSEMNSNLFSLLTTSGSGVRLNI